MHGESPAMVAAVVSQIGICGRCRVGEQASSCVGYERTELEEARQVTISTALLETTVQDRMTRNRVVSNGMQENIQMCGNRRPRSLGDERDRMCKGRTEWTPLAGSGEVREVLGCFCA